MSAPMGRDGTPCSALSHHKGIPHRPRRYCLRHHDSPRAECRIAITRQAQECRGFFLTDLQQMGHEMRRKARHFCRCDYNPSYAIRHFVLSVV